MTLSRNGGDLCIRPGNGTGYNAASVRAHKAMVMAWMLAMAFGSAGFIWYGVVSSDDPGTSIAAIGLGIFWVFMSVARIVKEGK